MNATGRPFSGPLPVGLKNDPLLDSTQPRLLSRSFGYLCSQPFDLLDECDTVFLEKSQVLGERCRPPLTLSEGEQRGRFI